MAKIKRTRGWAIYGRAGTGKTTLACTFPGPILLVDVNDEGTDSVSDVEDVFVMEPETWEELKDLYWYLADNPGKYQTVIIDTITQVQQLIVEEKSFGKKLKGKQAGDWGTMTKQDWGDVASEMKVWITDMRSLPMEVVFLAQDRVFNTGDEGDADGQIDPEVGPRLSPSVSSHLCAAVSVIGSTFIREVEKKVKDARGVRKTVRKKEYCIRVGPNSYYITKIRKPKLTELPDFLINPDYDKIIATISGEE